MEKEVKTPPVVEDKSIEIKKSMLDSLTERLEKQDKQIKMLIEVADKTRMHKFDIANQDPALKVVKISTYKGKIIVAWKSLVDEVFQDNNGRWHEKQEVVLYFIDNSKETVSYMDFVRNTNKVDTEVLSKTTLADGATILKVDALGQVFEINTTFVN